MSKDIFLMKFKNKKLCISLISVFVIMLSVSAYVLTASRIGNLESCLLECTRYSPEQTSEFQVLNLNMLHGYPDFDYLPARLELIADHVKIISPDFVTLQEVPWTRATHSSAKFLAEETGMNYVYLPVNGNRWTIFFAEGEAILSKYPLKDVEFIELSPQAGFFEHRAALKATAVTSLGEIHIVSTHLTDGNLDINLLQTQDLHNFVSAIDDGIVIVGGDFNATENSPQISFLDSAWLDTYRKANPDLPGYTCCRESVVGYPAETYLEKRIDYIFLEADRLKSSPILVDSQRVLNQPSFVREQPLWASDHIAILSKFRLVP